MVSFFFLFALWHIKEANCLKNFQQQSDVSFLENALITMCPRNFMALSVNVFFFCFLARGA